jgi:hypothetical protein
LYVVVGAALVIFFPGTRDWSLVKPVLAAWKGLFKSEPPSFPILYVLGQWVVWVAPFLAAAGGGAAAVFSVRYVARRVSGSRLDSNAWSAAAAIVGTVFAVAAAVYASLK